MLNLRLDVLSRRARLLGLAAVCALGASVSGCVAYDNGYGPGYGGGGGGGYYGGSSVNVYAPSYHRGYRHPHHATGHHGNWNGGNHHGGGHHGGPPETHHRPDRRPAHGQSYGG